MDHSKPQVVIFDPITWIDDWSYDVEADALRQLGADLVIPTDRDQRDALLPTADVVVVTSIDDLTASHIALLTRCVGVLCYSAGMDAVDLAASAAAGIPVRNVRAGTADVADHAMALLLAAWRMILPMTEATADGTWDLSGYPQFWEIQRLEGRTLGILGAGAIGQTVAHRARAFGMEPVATYRSPANATEDLPHRPVEELFSRSDAVILTASLTPTSRGIVNRRILSIARPGLILVNVGRGGLIVEDHLADALDAGLIRVAALDVRDPEPPDPRSDRLTGRRDVIQTPHMAGMSSDAMSSLHRLAADGIETLLREGGRL